MIPEALRSFLDRHDHFLIMGHQEPDADCLGSQLALGSFLTRMGKTVKQYNHGPFKRAEINRYQPLFQPRVNPFDKVNRPGVLVVDCSTLDRIGDLQQDVTGLEVAVIDHHAAGQSFGDIRWIEAHRSSCTWLIHRLITGYEMVPTADEAYWLMLGLATDTGFFRHLEAGSGESFRTAADLADAGASPKAVFAQINGGKVLANQKLMGLILSRTESLFGGKVMYSWESQGDRAAFGADNRESDVIYQTLQGVVGVELIVLLRQDTADSVTGGLRSRSFVDVGALAQKFGGGGHIRASGFSCSGTVPDVKARILAELGPLFS
ncbi:MAG TPA: bifunctional oligoribonuclease/PAP phosphatase NrnA [Spirochaetia bacterium]|nr:bifunctional oligoribonuclease/PAP phosphatase NrnA [Spirochaetia bacterium]